MFNELCNGLSPLTSCVISHCFQKPADCFLVTRSDASVLSDQAILHFRKRFIRKRGADAIDDESNVKSQLACSKAQVRRGGITRPRFVISLSSF